MPIKISVNRKFVVNGKEYASVADLPDDVRHAYERAIGRSAHGDDPDVALAASKIVFNGQEYGSVDEMPANVRRMYDAVMVAMEGSTGAPSAVTRQAGGWPDAAHMVPAGTAPPPLVPEASASRTLIILTAAGLLLLVAYVLSSMSTTP